MILIIGRIHFVPQLVKGLTFYFSPVNFGATPDALFPLNYWLREFPLSAVVNRFEFLCESKEADPYSTKSVQ